MSKYIDAEKLIERLEEMKQAEYENCGGVNSKTGALQEVQELIESLQQEQPEVELEKTVEFDCIGTKVKMTIQELINYYIDSECCDVANECGF